jgi:hypothetical protein
MFSSRKGGGAAAVSRFPSRIAGGSWAARVLEEEHGEGGGGRGRRATRGCQSSERAVGATRARLRRRRGKKWSRLPELQVKSSSTSSSPASAPESPRKGSALAGSGHGARALDVVVARRRAEGPDLRLSLLPGGPRHLVSRLRRPNRRRERLRAGRSALIGRAE